MDLLRGLLLMLVLCASLPRSLAEEAEKAVRHSLPQATAHLIEAQAQVQSACASAGVTVPGGLSDVLIVRRTIAADWQRRLDSGAIAADDHGLVRFTADLERLVSGMQQLANLAQQLGDAPRRYPHCVAEPAFKRYHALVVDAVDQGMQAISAGRLREQVAPAAWYQRQARHAALLALIEAGHVAAERYTSLPRDDRWLVEYREHLLLTRTTLEQTIETVDDDRSYEQQEILDAYTRLLDARVQNAERIADCGLEGEVPEVMTFRRACELQIGVLARQLGLARSVNDDSAERSRMDAREHLALLHAERLKTMAGQWLSFESERREQAQDFAEVLDEAPAAVAAQKRALLDGFAVAQRSAQVAFHQALVAADLAAALTAQQAVEQVRHQREWQWAYFEEDLAIAEREKIWRAHAKDPAVAERLRHWDLRRAAVLVARRAAADAADAALTAVQASQRAELVAEEAQAKADALGLATETGESDLSDLEQALDEMVDLRAGDAVK